MSLKNAGNSISVAFSELHLQKEMSLELLYLQNQEGKTDPLFLMLSTWWVLREPTDVSAGPLWIIFER